MATQLIHALLASAGLFLGAADTVDTPRTLTLTSEPIPPHERLAGLELISRDPVLAPDQPPVEIHQGDVTIGQCDIFRLPPPNENLAFVRDSEHSSLYFIRFPYSFHKPKGSKRFKEIELYIDIPTQHTRALDLYPLRIEQGTSAPEILTIRPGGSFGPASEASKAGWRIQLAPLEPVIKAFGLGQHQFYWVFSSPQDKGVEPGTRHVLAILEVPRGKSALPVEISYRATVAHELFGVWFFEEARSGALTLDFDLQQKNCSVGEVEPAFVGKARSLGPPALSTMTLRGTPDITVQMLEPPDRRANEDAQIRQQIGWGKQQSESIERLFARAVWSLTSNGSFRFTPSPNAAVRDDLFPLTGSYRRDGDAIELRANRQAPLGATASLDGFLRQDGEDILLDAIYTVVSGPTSRLARITQRLHRAPRGTAPSSLTVGGVAIPSTFEIVVSATMDGKALPDAQAKLKLQPPPDGSSDPLSVSVELATPERPGAFMWFAPFSIPGQNVPRTRNTVAGNRVTSTVLEAAANDPLAPFWIASPRDPRLAGLIEQYVITGGELAFTVEDGRVSGSVAAQGWSLFAPGAQPARYAARFHGRLQGTVENDRFEAIDPSDQPEPGEQSADSLRYRAQDLINQGRCQEARPLLEAALERNIEEEQQSAAQSALLAEGVLIDRINIFNYLIACDFALQDYEQLIGHLGGALQVRHQVGAKGSLDRLTAEKLAEVAQRLDDFRTHLETFIGHFTAIRDSRQSSPSVARAADTCASTLNGLQDLLRGDLELMRSATGTSDSLLARLDQRPATIEQRARSLLAAGREVFADQPRLLAARERLLDSFRGGVSAQLSVTDLTAQETKVIDDLKASSDLSIPEKEFFYQQMNTAILMLTNIQLLRLGRQSVADLRIDEQIQRRQKDFQQASKILASYFDRWRERLVTDLAKIEALDQAYPFFEQLIAILIDMGAVDDALVASEMARGRAFLDLLAHRPEIRASLDPSLLAQGTVPNPGTAPALTSGKIRSLVERRGGTVVEYFLSSDELMVWVLSADDPTTRLVRIRLDRNKLRTAVNGLQELLETSHTSLEKRRTVDSLLRELHALLIEPVASHLPEDPTDLLTLIPHQELFRVPFAALKDAQGRSLIERHTLIYGASLAVLEHLQKARRAPDPPTLLALVAPSPFPPAANLSPLDTTGANFNLITRFYPPENRRVLSGRAATREALFNHAAKASVVYLATHAKFQSQDRAELPSRDPSRSSYIALADLPPGSGYLREPDVYRLDLSADLVILGACQTGRGDISGDGVLGLSRAFTWAGASSLILSLWEIPEQESLRQLFVFHHAWREQGLSKAHALALAQREFLKLHPDQPKVWAGFVLYGEMD